MADNPIMKTLTIDNVTYEIYDEQARTQIGDLSKLNTTAKTDLVTAINEAAHTGGNSGGNADQSGLTQAQIIALDGMFKICAYTADATDAYKAFQTAFGIENSGGGEVEPDVPVVPDEPEKTLTSISAVYSGGDVTAGTAVSDLTGIVVTAHYSDGTSEAVTGYTLSGTIAEGSNTITVSYGGKTTTFTVTGTAESGGEEDANLLTDVEWTAGLRVLANGAVYENQASWQTSDYVNVTEGKTLRVQTAYTKGHQVVVSFWDSEKVAVGNGISPTLNHASNPTGNYVDVAIPSGAVYARICTEYSATVDYAGLLSANEL